MKLKNIILYSVIILLSIAMLLIVIYPRYFVYELITNRIENKYGVNIYYNENPEEKYDIDLTYNMDFNCNLNMYSLKHIVTYLTSIEEVLSTLNENTYEDLPDIYFCKTEECAGCTYHSDKANVVVLKLDLIFEETIKRTLYHEIFHSLTLYKNEQEDKYQFTTQHLMPKFYEKFTWIEEDKSVITPYATTSLHECMAEAFAESIVREDDNEYFKLMREYAWPTILKQEFIDELKR